jgi:hypothetical protein
MTYEPLRSQAGNSTDIYFRVHTMKLLKFTFKNEAMWMMIFSLGLPSLAVLTLIAVLFLRSLRSY